MKKLRIKEKEQYDSVREIGGLGWVGRGRTIAPAARHYGVNEWMIYVM
jgi:hypothetical protein